MKTTATKKSELTLNWHFIDAKGKVLGKVATEIVHKLQGKHKPNYVPYLNMGDKIVVTNSKHVVLTGQKEEKKIYYKHSGYAGNLKTHTASQVRASNPNRMIIEAVRGMLPKNRLRDVRMSNLYVYEDDVHPHSAQLGKDNGKI